MGRLGIVAGQKARARARASPGRQAQAQVDAGRGRCDGRWTAGRSQAASCSIALAMAMATGQVPVPTCPKAVCLDRQDKHGPDWGKEGRNLTKREKLNERKERLGGVDVGIGKEGRSEWLQMSSDSLFSLSIVFFLSLPCSSHSRRLLQAAPVKQYASSPRLYKKLHQQPLLFRNNISDHTTELSGLTSPISSLILDG